MEGTQNYNCQITKGDITSKMYRQELWFLCSAHWLMMLYISMKFHENILNGFRTKLPVKFQRGIATKLLTRGTVLVLCTLSDDALCFNEVS